MNEIDYTEAEKHLNADILKITMTITEQYPELSKYLEEMPISAPDKESPEISLKHLKSYYDSLNALLHKYRLEHPNND